MTITFPMKIRLMWSSEARCDDNGFLVITSHNKHDPNHHVTVLRDAAEMTNIVQVVITDADGSSVLLVNKENLRDGFVTSARTIEGWEIRQSCVCAMLTGSREMLGWLRAGGIVKGAEA